MREVATRAERLLAVLLRSLRALGWAASLLWLLACPLLWVLRDGLGPRSRETAGWEAVWRFSPVLLVGLALACYLALAHLAAWWLLSPGRGGDRNAQGRGRGW